MHEAFFFSVAHGRVLFLQELLHAFNLFKLLAVMLSVSWNAGTLGSFLTVNSTAQSVAVSSLKHLLDVGLEK